MSLLNRVILVFFALALAGGAITVVVLAWTIPERTLDGLYNAVDWLSDHNQDAEKGILTAGAAAVLLFALGIVLLEVMPSSGSEVNVTDLSGGDAVLSIAAISGRVEEAVREVPYVNQVKASVRTRKKGVVVGLTLGVDPAASLAAVSDEASEATRRVLADRVHVELMEPPHARLYYQEQRRGGPVPIMQREAPAPAVVEPVAVVAEETPPVTPEAEPVAAEAKSRSRRGAVSETVTEEAQ